MNTLDRGVALHTSRVRANIAPTLGVDPPEWTIGAVCASTDPDLFYPEKGGSTREAKIVCRGCPVVTECLTYALENSERFGIWGGLSERERRRLARSRRPVADLIAMGLDGREECPQCGLRFVRLVTHQRLAHKVLGAA